MKRRTISIDESAYECLEVQKDILRQNGWGSPNFSDAIKLACGDIKVAVNEVVE